MSANNAPQPAQGFYDWLLQLLSDKPEKDAVVDELMIGLVWTLCRSGDSHGLAMTPQSYSRTLDWPGTLAGRPLGDLAAGIQAWEPFNAVAAMAAINAAIHAGSSMGPVFDDVVELPAGGGNLAVFEHFLPRIQGARIVVIGRYPGMERYEREYDLQVIERQPGPDDFPDTAAETLLPGADWVFLTASSIINKTFPRLAELSRKATLVLMGPSTPWLPEMAEWGVDYLAGTVVHDEDLLRRCVAEGGGRVIFDAAVRYAVADIGQPRMHLIKTEIAAMAMARDRLKADMEDWYGSGRRGRYPQLSDYEKVLAELSTLDTQYKWMWDARNPTGRTE